MNQSTATASNAYTALLQTMTANNLASVTGSAPSYGELLDLAARSVTVTLHSDGRLFAGSIEIYSTAARTDWVEAMLTEARRAGVKLAYLVAHGQIVEPVAVIVPVVTELPFEAAPVWDFPTAPVAPPVVSATYSPDDLITVRTAETLHKTCGRAGIRDHYAFASEVLGRPVAQFRTLTRSECHQVTRRAGTYTLSA